MKYSLLIASLFISQVSLAKILVLEHNHNSKVNNGNKVASIACKDQADNCILQSSESLIYIENYKMYDDRTSPYDSKKFFNTINMNLLNTNVVNINIGFQYLPLSERSKAKHESGLEMLSQEIINANGPKKK